MPQHSETQRKPDQEKRMLHKGTERPDGSTAQSWYPLDCGHCGADAQAAVVAHRTAEDIQWLLCPRCFGGSVVNEGVSSPPVRTGFAIEGLPESVNLAYQQARDSLAVGAYTGVELICRKILMHVAADKGAGEGEPFASYIEYLAEQGYVTPTMWPWVKRIKDNANEATHRLPESTKNRAQSTLVFTAELLRLTYEMEYMTNLHSSGDPEQEA